MNVRKENRERVHEEAMLSTNTRLLVAIAGAVSQNCKPCLETLVPEALRYGITPEEIAEVVSTVAEVRESAFASTLDLVTKLLGPETGEKLKQACSEPGDCPCTQPVSSPDSSSG